MSSDILLIVTDQLSQQALRTYGNQHSVTPNIDRLAARGTRFSQCYTPCPLCQPARAAFWTGRFPHETSVLSNGRNFPVTPVPETMPALGELFATAGYDTAHFGKTHDAGSLRGFRHDAGTLSVEQEEGPWMLDYETFEDRYATEKTVKYLRTLPPQPFLAVADLQNPHNICSWIGMHQGAHEDAPIPTELPLPPTNLTVEDFASLPLPVQYICCSHNRQAQAAGWNATNYRYYLAAYYHYLTRVDSEIGRILDALDATPRGRDTLVMLFSDHGDSMGGRGLVTKQVSFYDETTRVPLIVAGAGVGEDVAIDTPLVSLLDLLPTLCDYASIPAPDGLWGRSLLPLLHGETAEPHPYVASEWHTGWGFTIEPGRMLRTPGWKYTRYREENGEELYDLTHDPGETRNLAGDSACTAVLRAHQALLEEHLTATADPFQTLEPLVDPRWRSHTPGYHHHTGPAAPMVS